MTKLKVPRRDIMSTLTPEQQAERRAKQKKYNEQNKEKRKQWLKNNPEYNIKWVKNWQANNREKVNATARRYYNEKIELNNGMKKRLEILDAEMNKMNFDNSGLSEISTELFC